MNQPPKPKLPQRPQPSQPNRTTPAQRLTESHQIFEIPENESEDLFENKYRIASGMIVNFIPLSETHLYDEAKAKALKRAEANPETQFDFYGNEYYFRRYQYDESKSDFVCEGNFKLRIFKMVTDLDINSNCFDPPPGS